MIFICIYTLRQTEYRNQWNKKVIFKGNIDGTRKLLTLGMSEYIDAMNSMKNAFNTRSYTGSLKGNE